MCLGGQSWPSVAPVSHTADGLLNFKAFRKVYQRSPPAAAGPAVRFSSCAYAEKLIDSEEFLQ